jgi:hypothetical protein
MDTLTRLVPTANMRWGIPTTKEECYVLQQWWRTLLDPNIGEWRELPEAYSSDKTSPYKEVKRNES